MVSGLKPRAALRYEYRQYYEQIFRGIGLYPWVLNSIINELADQYVQPRHLRERARIKKMRFEDFIIHFYTKKIKNTKIARKMNKGKIIKHYKDTDEWMRILK